MTGAEDPQAGGSEKNTSSLKRRGFLFSAVTTSTVGLTTNVATAEEGTEQREGDTLVPVNGLSDEQLQSLVEAVATDEFSEAVTATEYLGQAVQVAIFTDELQEFPRQGTTHAVLSSGVATDAPGDPSAFSNTDVSGRQIANYSPDNYDAFDVAELRIDFTIPEGAEGIAFDWQFATEENPEYLDSQFQDFFEALLFLPDGSVRNIGTLPNGDATTVQNANAYSNSPGGTSPQPTDPLPDPSDISYNAVTSLQTSQYSVGAYVGEEARIVIRIADASDGVLDSAVLFDNLQFLGEVEGLPGPVEQALNTHRDTIVEDLTESIRIEAKTDAKIYNEFGAKYAENFVNYLGYAAGELDESAVDEELRTIVDQSTNLPEKDALANAYTFYDELYSAAADVTAENRVELFQQYLMGTAEGQTNTLTHNGQTIAELIEIYKTETFPAYKTKFLTELAEKNYTSQEIQQITSFINKQTTYIDSKLDIQNREAESVTDIFLGNADLTGNGVGAVIEDVDTENEETGSQEVGTDVIGTSVVIGGLIVVKKLAAAGLIAKGGLGVAIKSTGAAKTISSIAGASKVGSVAKGVLATKPGAAVAKAAHGFAHLQVPSVPSSASVASWSTLKWASVEIASEKVFERLLPGPGSVSGVASAIIDYPFEAVLDGGEFEDSSGMPEMCLERSKREATISNLEAPDLNLTDILDEFEIGNLPENIYYEDGEFYGLGDGSLTIKNTGDSTFTPSPQLEIKATNVSPSGTDETTGYPICVRTPLSELDPGESETLTVEYAVPLGLFTSSYELIADLTWSDAKTTASFEAGSFAFEFPSFELFSGSLSDGEQVTQIHQPDPGTKTATYQMEYDQNDVDLHLYDDENNHVGENYQTNTFENEIAGATHSGHDSGGVGNEWVSVESVTAPEYTVELVSPEIGTVIQNQDVSSDSGVTTTSGGLDSAVAVETTEVPELTATAAFGISPSTADPGEVITTTTTIREVSESDPLQNVQFKLPELTSKAATDVIPADAVSIDQSGFTVNPGAGEEIVIEVALPNEIDPATYRGDITVSANGGDTSETETLAIAVLPEGPQEPLGTEAAPPTDPNEDGLYEDLTGNGESTVEDVYVLFDNLETNAIQTNSKAFNFALDDDSKVTLRDVQALYQRITGGE